MLSRRGFLKGVLYSAALAAVPNTVLSFVKPKLLIATPLRHQQQYLPEYLANLHTYDMLVGEYKNGIATFDHHFEYSRMGDPELEQNTAFKEFVKRDLRRSITYMLDKEFGNYRIKFIPNIWNKGHTYHLPRGELNV